jgi:outer membrane protein assembly factor BamB
MNSHRRLLIDWLQKARVGFLALAASGCAVSTNLAQPQKSDSESLIAGWKVPLDLYGSAPVISDGVLYLGSRDGAVYALESNTGERKWRFQTGENLPPANQVITVTPETSLRERLETLREKGERRVHMPPAVGNGTVFIGSGDNSFYAIDAATGKKKWSYVAGPGMITGLLPAPVLKDGTVCFPAEQHVHALDMATGERKWLFEALQEKPIPSRRIEGMVPGENAIFVTAWSRTTFAANSKMARSLLYAVAPDTGTTNWVAIFDGINISAPKTAKGIVFVTVEDPPPRSSGRITLYAINTADGQIRWKLGSERTSSLSSLVIVGTTIYFSTGKSLFAAELETGRRLWSFRADEIHSGDEIKTWSVQADDQHLYVSTGKFGSKGTLHALALATGKQKWSQDGSVDLVHGGILYGSHGNAFRAIDAATGRKLWSTKLSGSPSPVLISGGRIFLISPTSTTLGTGRVDQGYLYAINARTGKLRP